MGRQPRQRPISCKLCRQRKLRCSRVFPCSNCTCRGVACEHDGPATAQALAKALAAQTPRSSSAATLATAVSISTSTSTSPDTGASASASATNNNTNNNTNTNTNTNTTTRTHGKQLLAPKHVPNSQLLARLERLEALVAAQTREAILQPKPSPAASSASFSEIPPAQFPAVVESPISPQLQQLTDDALLVESSSFADQPMMQESLYDPISFRTCPARRILRQGGFVLQNDAAAASLGSGETTKCIWLPRRDEARILVHKYISDVNHFHHTVHAPTLPSIIEALYDTLDRNAPLDIGIVSLLLGICAAATYTWSPRDDARLLYGTVEEARAQTPLWCKAAFDVLDHAQRIGHASLECIHGVVILFYVFCNSEGLSTRARGLISRSIAMARELALHRIDIPNNRDVSKMGNLKLELCRRTWWFLAATDWMVTQFTFPQESSFTIHPFHMSVRKPSNVNDVDIVDSQPVVGRPLTEPTDASSLIYRIRLAELCQTMLEKDRASAYQSETADHKFVMEMDSKFRAYLRELPDFFSLDKTAIQSLSPLDPRRNPKITIQRYTLNLLIYRHLCKLHLPFLARGSVESAYAYSYETCLMAARMIIQIERHLKLEDLPFSTTRLRSVIVLRSVFLASIALVLSACTDRQSQGSSVNDSHLVEAWRIIDDAKDDSVLGAQLLDFSVQVLRRHLPNHAALKMFSARSVVLPTAPDSTCREDQRRNMPFQGFVPEANAVCMDQQWQALEGRMDFNTIDFDKLFCGLEAPFI